MTLEEQSPFLPHNTIVIPVVHMHRFKEADVLIVPVNGLPSFHHYGIWLGWENDDHWVIDFSPEKEIDLSQVKFSESVPGLVRKKRYSEFYGKAHEIGILPVKENFDNESTRKKIKDRALQFLDHPRHNYHQFMSDCAFATLCWDGEYVPHSIESTVPMCWKHIHVGRQKF